MSNKKPAQQHKNHNSKEIIVIHRRGHPLVLLITTVLALLMASLPVTYPATAEWSHNQKVNSVSYKQKYGFWETIDLPEEFMTNTIHAAALPTGKILLVAGSGNNRKNFNEYTSNGNIKVLKSVILDPETLNVKLIPTPSDLFCSGHALLQSGNLLIAGGTSGYELQEKDVKKAAGPITIHNENPDSPQHTFAKGTKFTSPNGKIYVSTQEVIVKPATKIDHGNGNVMIHHSSTKVFVEAINEGASFITDKTEQYKISGLEGTDTQNIYGQGGPMTLKKQDFRGDNKTFEFDSNKEEYVPVGDLNESRWYASLPVLTNGEVLAVSGLDNTGNITDTTERYDPLKKIWSWGPNRALPTYPALFRTQDPEVLFYSGSSAGYGPEDVGREPGFWNINKNSFQTVAGLRDPNILETSGSVVLPPIKGSNDGSQSNRIMLAGGGGVGESNLATSRTDIIDLSAKNPVYTPGPDLPSDLRYINLAVTPWDEVFATGGSRDYRAKNNSYSKKAFSINATNYQITPLADEPIGRTYHSGALLLQDGRILVFGGDPLFNDKDNTTIGQFEQRLEIYTPPQFFRGSKPTLIGKNSQQISRGQTITFDSTNPDSIKTARIIPPSSTTHVTNIEQRSISAIVTKQNNKINIKIPDDQNLLPKGWYMLFVVNSDGLPSKAKIIEIAP